MSGEYYCKADNARTGHGQTDILTDIISILIHIYKYQGNVWGVLLRGRQCQNRSRTDRQTF